MALGLLLAIVWVLLVGLTMLLRIGGALADAVHPPRAGPTPPPPPRPGPPPAVQEARSQYVGPQFAARRSGGTECQVCGQELSKDVVACPTCATLHHRECWDYAGGCSTYGCRG